MALHAEIATWLGISDVPVVHGLFHSFYWPLAGMIFYAVMTYMLQYDLQRRNGKPRGVPTWVVQTYNVVIIAISFLICVSTLVTRVRDFPGLKPGFCPLEGLNKSAEMRLCFWMFHASKYIEFIDTVFLVLKGKEVGTLHYWHHLLVILITWVWTRTEVEFLADGAVANTFVHCVMYTYYYLAGVGKPPRWK